MLNIGEHQTVNNQYGFSCEGCIFAQRTIIGFQRETGGCKFNRIEKYKKDGFEVKKNKYYFVKGLMGCSSKRTHDWDYSSANFEIQTEQIKKAHQLQYDIILYWPIGNGQLYTDAYLMQDLEKNLKNLDRLKVQPNKIIFAYRKDDNIDIQEIAKKLDATKIHYGISCAETDQDEGGVINLAYQLTESPYMWVYELDMPVYNIPNAVNEKLINFERVLLSRDFDDVVDLFTNTVLFEQLKGCDSLDKDEPNSIQKFIDKVQVLVDDQCKQSLIYFHGNLTNEYFNR